MYKSLNFIDNGFIHTLEGDVTLEDLVKANTQMFDHPNFHEVYYHIWDYRNVENFHVHLEDLEKFNKQARQKRKTNHHIKVALVANKPFTYGLSRMFSLLSENSYWKFEIFKTMEEAEEWVNLKDKSSASSQI